jgi:hypothetical protein
VHRRSRPQQWPERDAADGKPTGFARHASPTGRVSRSMERVGETIGRVLSLLAHLVSLAGHRTPTWAVLVCSIAGLGIALLVAPRTFFVVLPSALLSPWGYWRWSRRSRREPSKSFP